MSKIYKIICKCMNVKNFPDITFFLVKHMMMLIILLSSIFAIALRILNKLSTELAIGIIMLFFIYVSLLLVLIIQNSDKKSEEIVKKISSLIDQKTRVQFSNKIVDSKFEFNRLINNATKSIFIVGPNLHFLTNQHEEKKKILFQKFETNPNFELDILVSDPELKLDSEVTKSLGYDLSDSEYKNIYKSISEFIYGDPNFHDQLEDAIEIFKGWEKDFDKMKNAEKSEIKGKFRVRNKGIISVSLVFIDADTQNGCVLIIPVPWRIPGSERPCFLINYQNHESGFMQYYTAYRRLFSDANK